MKIDDLHIKKINDDEMEVSTSDQELVFAVDKGVMEDALNIPRLTFWSVITVLFMVVMVGVSMQIYTYWGFRSKVNQAIATEYKDLVQKRAADANTLSTYGMVDGEAGVFRIPLDEAIDQYVGEQSEQ